jgi:hypothetical protein
MAGGGKLLSLSYPYAWIRRGHDNRGQGYSLAAYRKVGFGNVTITVARDCYRSDCNPLCQSCIGDCHQCWVRGLPQCRGRNIAATAVLSVSPSGCELLGPSREDRCVGWANADGYDIFSPPKELAAAAHKKQEW